MCTRAQSTPTHKHAPHARTCEHSRCVLCQRQQARTNGMLVCIALQCVCWYSIALGYFRLTSGTRNHRAHTEGLENRQYQELSQADRSRSVRGRTLESESSRSLTAAAAAAPL